MRLRPPRRLLRVFAALAATGALALACLFALLWVEHRTELTLPAPTGSFPVGRAADVCGNLAVWFWYPAAPAPGARPAEYLPAPWRAALYRSSGVLMSDFLTRDLARVRPHATVDPALSPARRAWPVVILRPGLGALTADETTLAEDLASHGYVVVGFDAPYLTSVVVLPNGRVFLRPPANNPEMVPAAEREALAARLLTQWTARTTFVVDRLVRLNASQPPSRFAGRLDLAALGIVGHSLGGATAARFCHDDPRCRAGIDIDGALWGDGSLWRDGLRQPFLLLMSDHGSAADPENRAILSRLQSFYDRLPPNSRWAITIRGAHHFSFTDQVLLKSRLLLGILRALHVTGPLGARRGLAITADYIERFFDVYLNGAPASRLAPPSPYPEVREGLRNSSGLIPGRCGVWPVAPHRTATDSRPHAASHNQRSQSMRVGRANRCPTENRLALQACGRNPNPPAGW